MSNYVAICPGGRIVLTVTLGKLLPYAEFLFYGLRY